MKRRKTSASVLLVLLIASAALGGGGGGCSSSNLEVGPPPPGGGLGNGGGSSDGAGQSDASATNPTSPLMCPTDQCPDGRVTCPNATAPCTSQLDTDPTNCGQCGNACGYGFVCQDGKCRLRCDSLTDDCNHVIEDGCEASLDTPENCGACGVSCDVCVEGKCCTGTICPSPFFPNVKDCVDTQTDFYNCNACGHQCPDLARDVLSFVYGVNALPACDNGMCGKLACLGGYDDCNGDLERALAKTGDGCEVNTDADVNNCRKCGSACAPGQGCVEGKCVCSLGEFDCDPRPDVFTCANLNSDPLNCGACGYVCPAPPAPAFAGELTPAQRSVNATCTNGMCGARCTSNLADCDHDLVSNGCETSLLNDPLNCGECGHACLGTANQPCINGQCAEVACTDGEGIK